MLLALSIPPWGWWPLAFAGYAVVAWRIRGLSARGRFAAGWALGMGMLVPGWWWMGEFSAIGAALAVVAFSALIGVGVLATHGTGRANWLALPAGLVLAEALRGALPFGGVPMGGVALGQVSGPFAPAVRIGGALALVGIAALVGSAAVHAAYQKPRSALLAVATLILVTVVGAASPDGGGGPTRRVAVVQGGGRRGFRAIQSDPDRVFRAQVAASAVVRPPVDLVLWPEDVIDVIDSFAGDAAFAEVADLARRLDATVSAGVVEDAGPDHFRNASLFWSPAGLVSGRYDKVHRVPYGEYIPGRSLIRHFVNLDVVERDALPGHGPGYVATSAGPMGVTISYEVFFADRARAAVRAGGRLLLVPTNAASFRTSQVPATELAAARLRAIETGRDVVQAAPTGYSGFIDNRGRLRARTVLGRRQVLQRRVHLRHGRTVYVRVGDAPIIVLAVAALVIPRLRRPKRLGRRRP